MAMVTGALATFLVALSPVIAGHASAATRSALTAYPAISVPDTNYAIPAGALFVSPTGSDTNAGTQAAPLLTIGRAVAVATTGTTIVLRAGTYRETLGSVYRQLTLQPYPHEQVWLKGSRVVSNFVPSGSTWVLSGWSTTLCGTCFDPQAIDSASPNAGLPEMVFFDGSPLAQVTSLSSVVAGTFFVDKAAAKLYLGSDPTGHVVESSTMPRALEFDTTGAAGSTIRGIGFAQYAPTWDMSSPAMVVSTVSGVLFENDAFAWSASRGLSIFGANNTVRNSVFVYNGFTALHGDKSDGLDVEGNYVAFSNQEHFAIAATPVAGAAGIKVTSTKQALVKNNVAEDNWGNGIWFDISSYNSTVVNNLAQRNATNGLAIELSTKFIVASNVSADNGKIGLKISGATQVRAYNNTLADNHTTELGVYEDSRTNTNQAEVALGITWDTANVSLANNIMTNDVGPILYPLLHTFDTNSPKKVGASAMIVSEDYNVMGRQSASNPKFAAVWANMSGPYYSTNYLTQGALSTGVGVDTHGWAADNYSTSPLYVNEQGGNWAVSSTSPMVGTGAPLPSDIAAAVGVTGGVAVNRGGLVFPVGTQRPPTGVQSVAPPPPALTTSVLGVFNATNGDYLYTIDPTEASNAVSRYQYTSLGTVFHAASASGTGLVPLYRLHRLGAQMDHLYTTDTTERANKIAAGYSDEGIAAYVPAAAASGFVPIYRFNNPTTFHHRMSTSSAPLAGETSDGAIFLAAP